MLNRDVHFIFFQFSPYSATKEGGTSRDCPSLGQDDSNADQALGDDGRPQRLHGETDHWDLHGPSHSQRAARILPDHPQTHRLQENQGTQFKRVLQGVVEIGVEFFKDMCLITG